MKDALEFVFILVALIIGLILGCNVMNSLWEKAAVKAGKAEFYLDADNNKEWRWK